MAQSGRKAYLEQQEREAVKRRVEEQAAQSVLDNRKMARRMLQKLVVDFAGWQELDEWAKDALDRLEKGNAIDLRGLKSDIDAWKKEHGLEATEASK